MAIIGLQMYTLRKHMNDKEEVFESLKKVAAIGYQQVQISVPAFMTVEELKAMLDEVGLKADSAMCYVMKVNDSQEEFDKVIHNAEVLGTKTIRLDGMPMDMAQTANGFKGYAAILDRLGRRFHLSRTSRADQRSRPQHPHLPQGTAGKILVPDPA